jgi:hypothetical protein
LFGMGTSEPMPPLFGPPEPHDVAMEALSLLRLP